MDDKMLEEYQAYLAKVSDKPEKEFIDEVLRYRVKLMPELEPCYSKPLDRKR